MAEKQVQQLVDEVRVFPVKRFLILRHPDRDESIVNAKLDISLELFFHIKTLNGTRAGFATVGAIGL